MPKLTQEEHDALVRRHLATRIAYLRSLVRYYDFCDYMEYVSEVSDHDYEELYQELQYLESLSTEPIPSDSPTQGFGGGFMGRNDPKTERPKPDGLVALIRWEVPPDWSPL